MFLVIYTVYGLIVSAPKILIHSWLTLNFCPLVFFLTSVDSEGRVVRINYNNATRESVLDLPLHQVQPFYRALKAYVDIMNRPENVVTYVMEPGRCTPPE